MATEHPHIFLPEVYESKGYSTPPKNIDQGPRIPKRDRESHGEKLQKQWAAIWAKAREQEASRTVVSMPTKDGVYVEFEGKPGFDLISKSLEDKQAQIRLLNVYTIKHEGENKEITRATVFIPSGKHDHFLNRIRQYAEEETKRGKPKNAPLIESVEDFHLAVFEGFWRDDPDLMPGGTEAVWCEVWLLDSGADRDAGETRGEEEEDRQQNVESRFRDTAETLRIALQPRALRFPERLVLLAKATREQLSELLAASPDIAEFRRAKETARFFLELENRDQTEWVRELRSRLRVNPEAKVAVCVLDTGANNGHELLKPVLADSDCYTVEPSWGVSDHDKHGTLMCGVAAFGDLLDALQHSRLIRVEHCLESTKILPPSGDNDPDLYGDITIQGLSRAEIGAPDREHIGCMAVTSEDGRDKGRPSSWSAAIDKLTAGYDDDGKRLFIVAAGNVVDHIHWVAYPDSNETSSVHDPGQSWNALTVGAYTEKARLTDDDLEGHILLAQPGQLSPFSSTSGTWDGRWPAKPDVVLEGGNLAKAPDGHISEHDDLSLLSTGHRPNIRQLDAINATSAAAAQAAWMAAQIQASYPKAWPETIRALMVHTAEWPDAMKRQFLTPNSRGEYSKTDYGRLLRICGYGVPNLARVLTCASNSVTLIAQTEIQPFTKKEGQSSCSMNEMHLHKLPWPREVLIDLGEAPVELRITLSYFVEPSPGEVSYKDKYRYASHGLRFDVNNSGEDEPRFLSRLNAAAREDGERRDSDSGSGRWDFGVNNRSTGSIHSDIWRGTAAEIATCNLVGVYPVIGWWRERAWLKRWDRKARYSLVASLRTPEEKIDLYTPIAIELGIPVEVKV